MSEHGQEDLVGRLVDGRYDVESVLGRGGMGVVYRARHRDLDRPVALKVIHRQLCKDPKVAARFRREARAASALGHPNIIDVYDFGRLEDGSAYLAMELLAGRSLRDVLSEEGALPPARAVEIALHVCAALDAAHANGVIHRDMKPDNILVSDAGIVKVVDFGIAKVSSTEGNLTGTGELLGTPLYMSPEQCGGRDLDGRTDIYALGAILFEMLTGRPPFEGESLVSIVTQHVLEPAPAPTSINASVPPALEQVILACLEKAPDDRPTTMAVLAEQLSAAVGADPPHDFAQAPTMQGAARARPARSARTASLPELPPEAVAERSSAPVEAAPTPSMMMDGPIAVPTVSRAPAVVAVAVLLAAAGAGVFTWSQLRASGDGGDDRAASAVEPAAAAAEGVSEPEAAPPPDVGGSAVERPEGVEPPTVRLISEPPGATVLDGDRELGATPMTVLAIEPRTLTLRATDHDDRQIEVGPETGEALTVTLEAHSAPPDEERSSAARSDGHRRRPERANRPADPPERPDDPHPTNPLVHDPWGR